MEHSPCTRVSIGKTITPIMWCACSKWITACTMTPYPIIYQYMCMLVASPQALPVGEPSPQALTVGEPSPQALPVGEPSPQALPVGEPENQKAREQCYYVTA